MASSRRFIPAGKPADGEGLHRYRVVAVTSDIAALVECAGGFLCDRARAGWNVRVLVDGPGERRPLTILGVSADAVSGQTDAGAAMSGFGPGTTVIVGADLLTRDSRLRASAARLATAGAAVHVWGPPSYPGCRPAPIQHELSTAAQAFKNSALRAARIDRAAEPVETLYRLADGSPRRLRSV
ncbi:hypothetical protein KUF57_03965 [Mycolicibacterium sp. PAM1]|uniref:Uncharacterized protein n=1 Tax=Mycolicibacterium gilvum (strain PYR-GCK) TaxID=350054 RepID=A4TCA3_MYCGI|nr:hypothetical protein [Mycolicibacterium sp. PAM1]ABP46559.1 conserved hypothetical protein [Mycolicibacterium gilvum PYR-GCK]MBV5242687.1 hypothetical protein [Mycolicibacterium sp. PAM1]